jgi:hypothetical protein
MKKNLCDCCGRECDGFVYSLYLQKYKLHESGEKWSTMEKNYEKDLCMDCGAKILNGFIQYDQTRAGNAAATTRGKP